SKNWRHPVGPASDARVAYQLLDDFRDTVSQLERSLTKSSPSVVKKMLADLKINHYSKELSCSPLLQVLGKEQDYLNTQKRLAPFKTLFSQEFDTVFKLAKRDGSSALAVVSAYPPAIDHQRRAARFVINTPRIDRDGEIISPLGIDQSDYVHNAIVQWCHGLD